MTEKYESAKIPGSIHTDCPRMTGEKGIVMPVDVNKFDDKIFSHIA